MHHDSAAPQHRSTAAPLKAKGGLFARIKRSFTLVELLAAIAVIAVMIVAALPYVADYSYWAHQVADQRTLLVLNDALTRYKCEGGSLATLTPQTAIKTVITALQTPVNWAGQVNHQFLQSAFTVPARSVFATGSGSSYRFTQFNTFSNELGGTSPTGLIRIYLTTVGTSTWTVPNDWNSANSTIECIGGGGAGGNGVDASGGGGGGYSKISNLTLVSGTSVPYSVGAGGTSTPTDGSDTWFNGLSLAASSVGAKGGATGVHGSSNAPGGSAGAGVGTVKHSGGSAMPDYTNVRGSAGGGAAGPAGDGGVGTSGNWSVADVGGGGGANGGGNNGGASGAPSGYSGKGGDSISTGNQVGTPGGVAISINGNGNSGANGSGGSGARGTGAGGAGGNGAEWDSTHGSGGGGGGEIGNGVAGGNGGLYGGGGGGRRGAAGAQGLIVISYTH